MRQPKFTSLEVGLHLRIRQAETPYSKPNDFVFASFKLHGKKPRTENMIVADYIRPGAIKAGVTSVRDGDTHDNAGNLD